MWIQSTRLVRSTWMAVMAALLVTVGVASLRAADKDQAAKVAATQSEFPDDFFYYPRTEEPQQKLNELVGKRMPALSVSEWSNGEVKPDDMKGKVVLIDIWATWCGPCLRSIPHNNEMLGKNKEKGLLIIGVCSSQDGQENLAKVVESKKIAYPVCKDPDLKTEKAYHLSFYPTYIAVDRKGIVRAAGLNPDKVGEVIDKLLAEKAE